MPGAPGGRLRPGRPGGPGRPGLGVRRLLIRGFERAAQYRGAAPRLEHPALGLLLHPARPAQGVLPARRAQLLGSFYLVAAFLGRQVLYQIHADHTVVCVVCPSGRAALVGRAALPRSPVTAATVLPATAYAATSVLRGRPRGRLRGTIAPRMSSSPPQTPQGSRRSSAPVRHAIRARQSRHIAFACSRSCGDSAKNSSGSSVHGRSRPTGNSVPAGNAVAGLATMS